MSGEMMLLVKAQCGVNAYFRRRFLTTNEHESTQIDSISFMLVIEDFFNHGFEPRSLPRALAAARHGVTFYVADPFSSIRGLRG